MRFGVWHDFRNPPQWRRPWEAVYRENVDQIAWAETLGYDSAWLSEHHVTDDGYLPAVFPLLAALAERTSTMRLGTAVMLAPFQQPIRFAEEAAVVDLLSRGRLELGLGLGYRSKEFEALGIPRGERAGRTEELVEIARRAWTGEPFTYEGRHWRLDDVQVTPPPFQQPSPPIWIGGSTLRAAERAARLRCHFFPDAYAPREVIDRFWSALAELGEDPTPYRIGSNPSIYVTDDPERGWHEVGEHFLYQYNVYRRWFGESGFDTAPSATDPSQLPRERYIVGPPDAVVEAIGHIEARTGCDVLIFWARPPGLSIELSNRSVERFAREVIPRIRRQDAGPEPASPADEIRRQDR
ncbi:MAG: LLM class flavin-dependent oxidoreductase [Actinobacteria bacterium]|nr:LLM class flavin-dependent oxidoreductase [Actinomycetota bacterium]